MMTTDQLNTMELDMLVAKKAAACQYGSRKRALRRGRLLGLSREMLREVTRQIANYRAQWALLRRELRS